MTKLPLPIGISDFKKLKEAGYYFVDKTTFIRDIVTDPSEVVLFTRPRRFGKTINLSMLGYFLSNDPDKINVDLFNGTEIVTNKDLCSTYQNQFPVIFISFKDIRDNNFDDALSFIKALISDLFDSFKETFLPILSDQQKTIAQSLLDKTADKAVLKKSLFYLSQFLHKQTGKKPFLLIDEYDTPITAAYVNNYYDDMIDLMRGLLVAALKDNVYLNKGVITGITRVSQESIFSGLNNLEVYSMLREQSGEYFGFTETEVKQLLVDDGHSEQFESMKSWYNGYQVGKHTLYNPWSIINCVKQDYNYQPYWLNTSDNALIRELLSTDRGDIKMAFIDLLQDNSTQQAIEESLVFPRLKNNEKSVWSLLHASGYLNISAVENKNYKRIATLSIPNKEVSFIYHEMIENWFTAPLAASSYDRLIRALQSGDANGFKDCIANYLLASGSYFDFSMNTPEQVFHSFMLGLVIGLKDTYVIESNKEAGFGRFDLVLIPKDSKHEGIALEFKIARENESITDKAQEALNQIEDKQYIAAFSQHGIKSALLLGLAFHGKQVEIASATVKPSTASQL